MTSSNLQPSIRASEFLQHHIATSTPDELINAHSINEPSTTSSSPIATKNRIRAPHIPPPAPSPPAYSSRQYPPPLHHPINRDPPSAMATKGLGPNNQWLFTEEELRDTPSVRDGLSVAEESCRRAKGVNFIIQAGILLKIPQLTLGTAAVFFHRFYMRYSMVEKHGGIHHYNIAATALFLATKAEENCRKTKEIVIAVVKVAQKNASLIIDEQSKEFWRWKDSILLYEETMLELLTFDVVLESPYNHLYELLKVLGIQSNKHMRNVAWAFLNDSCMTTLCLQMPPKDIAVASIYFSAKFNNEKLADGENGEPWWEYIGGMKERITRAIDIMADFYTDNPLKKTENPYDRSQGSSPEDLDRTRLRVDSMSPSQSQSQPVEKIDGDGQGPQGPFSPGVDKDGNKMMNGKGENMSRSQSQSGLRVEAPRNGSGHGDINIDTGAGDSDAKLKALANDPATHQHQLHHGNGLMNNRTPDSKRKSPEPTWGGEPESKRHKSETGPAWGGEEPESKRHKSETDHGNGNEDDGGEKSEEGEVEE